MPIQNMGTLLENIVLVEAMRLLAQENQGNRPIDMLNSFAMPPLSEWRGHRTNHGFGMAQLRTLQAGPQPLPVDSYQACCGRVSSNHQSTPAHSGRMEHCSVQY